MDEDTEVLQQDIKIWAVCEFSSTPNFLDRVIFLQGSYSDEAVRRCRQRASSIGGIQIPVRFESDAFPSAAPPAPSADLDVRTVDPDTITMTSRTFQPIFSKYAY